MTKEEAHNKRCRLLYEATRVWEGKTRLMYFSFASLFIQLLRRRISLRHSFMNSPRVVVSLNIAFVAGARGAHKLKFCMFKIFTSYRLSSWKCLVYVYACRVFFSGKTLPMYFLLDKRRSKDGWKGKIASTKRERLERINYFSLADKSFPDLLCSTFFSSPHRLGRGKNAIYFKVFSQNIYLLRGRMRDEEHFLAFSDATPSHKLRSAWERFGWKTGKWLASTKSHW